MGAEVFEVYPVGDGERCNSGSLDSEAKDARRSRTVSKIEPGDAKIVHRQYAIAPDGTERLMMELVMTRAKKP